MKEISMCRICLAADVRLFSIAKHLQDMYEKLTALTFKKEDGRPLVVCYICHARLRNSYQLWTSCLRGDELLTQMLSSNVLIQISSTNSLRAVSVMQFSLGHVPQKSTYCPVDDTKLKEQYTEDKENQEHGRYQDNNVQFSQALSENSEISCDVKKDESDYIDSDVENIIFGTKSDINVDENGWEPFINNTCSEAIDNDLICPKIVKIVLQRMVLSDTKIGVSENKSSLATKAEIKIAKHKSIDNPIVISKRRKTVRKVDATLKKPKENKVTKARDEVRKLYKINGINRIDLRSKANVKRKVYKHTDQKRYPCNVCNKYFSYKCQLNIHKRSHTGDKPFSCDMCKKCFNTKSGLIEHIRTHTGEQPYMCQVCNKCFKNHRNLKIHARIHTGEKPYKCNKCTKSYNQPSSLVVHIRTHTGEKPFSCDECKKSFRYRRVLKGHMQKHTLFKAQVCL